jgi:hypothetical protein
MEERAYSELVEMPLTECVGRCKTGRLRPIPVHFVQVLSTRTFIPSQTIEGSRSSMSFYGVHDTGGNGWQNTEVSSGTSRGRPDYVNCAGIPVLRPTTRPRTYRTPFHSNGWCAVIVTVFPVTNKCDDYSESDNNMIWTRKAAISP